MNLHMPSDCRWQLTGLLRGHLQVAAMTFYSHHVDLPGTLSGFHRSHPAVEISLSVGSSDQLVAALRRGDHDLAFIGLGPEPPTDIETHTVASEPLLAVVGLDHPRVGAASIELPTLAAGPLISLPRGTGLRAQLDHACAAIGIAPDIAFEAADPRMAAQLAAHGFGFALVPASVADAQQHVHALTITGQTLQAQIALAWRATGPTSPAARELINHVSDISRALGTPASSSRRLGSAPAGQPRNAR